MIFFSKKRWKPVLKSHFSLSNNVWSGSAWVNLKLPEHYPAKMCPECICKSWGILGDKSLYHFFFFENLFFFSSDAISIVKVARIFVGKRNKNKSCAEWKYCWKTKNKIFLSIRRLSGFLLDFASNIVLQYRKRQKSSVEWKCRAIFPTKTTNNSSVWKFQRSRKSLISR